MLTPKDVETKVFKKSLRGYDEEDVDCFLQEIARELERLQEENRVANERVQMLSDAVKQYKSMEDTLQDALSVAHSNSEDVKKSAHEEAELILKNAQHQAEQLMEHSSREMAKTTYQYEQLKKSVEVFRAKVVSLLHAQLEIIKDYSAIEIDDKTVEEAKAVFEASAKAAENAMEQTQEVEIAPGFEHTAPIELA